MIADEKGIQLDTLNDILDAYELQLQGKYGSDFHIKPEGVIDNIANSAGFMELSLQQQIAFLTKNLDPETAEGIYQDWIYERQGCYRLKPKKSIIELNVLGSANLTINAGAITIRDTIDKNEFVNKYEITTDETGLIKGDFECVLYGDISVNDNANFEIVTAPDGVTEVQKFTNSKFTIGRNAETHEEYRIRFRNSKSINAKATKNANLANLLKFVSHSSYLKIKDKKTYLDMAPGTIEIIANHNTTDNIFAMAILDTIAGGIETIGDTSIMVQDNSNEYQEIKFKNAEKVSINIQADIKIMYGKFPNTVKNAVKNNILEYTKERIFGLGSTIYATEFIIPAYKTDGVEAFANVKVKRNSDTDFADSIQLEEYEVAEFSIDGIILNENI